MWPCLSKAFASSIGCRLKQIKKGRKVKKLTELASQLTKGICYGACISVFRNINMNFIFSGNIPLETFHSWICSWTSVCPWLHHIGLAPTLWQGLRAQDFNYMLHMAARHVFHFRVFKFSGIAWHDSLSGNTLDWLYLKKITQVWDFVTMADRILCHFC